MAKGNIAGLKAQKLADQVFQHLESDSCYTWVLSWHNSRKTKDKEAISEQIKSTLEELRHSLEKKFSL